jgi:3-hydroxyacyl-CoA dehydrogenase/enoyl-CoA hydratase/3-hydroxybutyryl-CoA epimerase
MPMGAFRVMDESGLDIAVNVQPVLSKTLGLEFEQYNALNELVKVAGAAGKKVGKGFYVYDSYVTIMYILLTIIVMDRELE